MAALIRCSNNFVDPSSLETQNGVWGEIVNAIFDFWFSDLMNRVASSWYLIFVVHLKLKGNQRENVHWPKNVENVQTFSFAGSILVVLSSSSSSSSSSSATWSPICAKTIKTPPPPPPTTTTVVVFKLIRQWRIWNTFWHCPWRQRHRLLAGHTVAIPVVAFSWLPRV